MFVIRIFMKLHNDTNSFNSTKKDGRLRKINPREDRMIQRLSIEDLFDTTAGISRQISTNLGKEVSRHILSRCLSIKPLISKTHELVCVFHEVVTWTDDNWSKVHFSDESNFNLVGRSSERRSWRQKHPQLLNCGRNLKKSEITSLYI